MELTVLNYWRKTGVAGHKILSFATVELKNREIIKQCIFLFGGLYIGLLLPASIKTQTIWDVPAGGPVGDGKPDSFGGHAVIVLAYDDQGLTVISWGKPVKMTWAFWDTYCDEAYALISADFFHGKDSPDGIDLLTLEHDLLGITGEKTGLMKQLISNNDGRLGNGGRKV